MTRLRFSIAQMMASVLLAGFGFAALRNADAIWASASYTLAIVVIATALVGALVRKGPTRATWTGFAVFGWCYFLVVHLPDWGSGGFGFGPIYKPVLLIESGITSLQPYIKPIPPGVSGGEAAGNFLQPYEQVSFSLGILLFGLVGAIIGHFLAAKDDRRDP
jgi:hypothetical protein